MAHEIESDDELSEIVRSMKVVAVVGMKDERKADEPAYTIPRMLRQRGVRVIPVNPTIASSLGEPSRARLADVDERVDVVDVFRRIDVIDALADEIVALPPDRRPPVVWMQSGIRHEGAAAKLDAAGIRVVMDRCLGVYTARYRPRG
jgi:predicted CoA-binding protein